MAVLRRLLNLTGPLSILLVMAGCTGDDHQAQSSSSHASPLEKIQAIDTSLTIASAIEAYDIDGDGDLDIISVGTTGEAMYWYEQMDGGEFREHLIAENMNEAYDIDVVDFDQDGDADIVAVQDQTVLMLFLNTAGSNASPIFEEKVINTSSFYCYEFCEIAIFDMDQNGIQDILLCTGQDCLRYLFDDIANMQYRSAGAIQFNGAFVANLEPQDVNQDGYLDLTYSLRAVNELTVVPNNEDGTMDFSRRQILPMDFGYCAAHFDDINQDGIIDVALGSDLIIRNSAENSFFNAAMEILSFQYPLSNQDVAAHPHDGSAKAVDIDSDGDKDIIVGSKYGWYLYYENTTTEEFAVEIDPYGAKYFFYQPVTTAQAFNVSRPVQIQDINQNGLPDILINQVVDGKILWADLAYLHKNPMITVEP